MSHSRSHVQNHRPLDLNWVATQTEANRNDRHVLQGRLSTAQSHLHKDAIRNAYLALGEFDQRTGNLKESLGSLMRATDYCTSRQQTAEVSILLLEVCLQGDDWGQVRALVTKMEHTLSGGSSSSTMHSMETNFQRVNVQLTIARGLERLARKDFATAAKIFHNLVLTTNMEDLEWPAVVSAKDIALYASLLSLACQSRAEISALAEHPEALELVPAMKELLTQWSKAKYAECMQAVSSEESDSNSIVPLGDIYLTGDIWKALRRSIQDTCLLQYIQPYQTIQLDRMARLFPSHADNLEETLVGMMSAGLIENARIDARNNILVKTPAKPTVQIAAMERRILDDTHALLVRLACLEHNLVVRDGTRSTGGRAGRRGGRGAPEQKANESDDDSHDEPMLDAAEVAPSAANPEDLY